MTENTTTTTPYGYRPPAVAVRATYSSGDTTDELVVEIDRWDGDVTVVTAVIDALTDRKPGAEVHVSLEGSLEGADNIRALRSATRTASEEARA